jgi:ribonuclease P protein subunit POP4
VHSADAVGAIDVMDTVDDDADSTRPRNLVFELHGNQFEFRPADRANRKFKWKTMDYL